MMQMMSILAHMTGVIIKPIISIEDANARIRVFACRVMDRVSINVATCFWYRFVDLNHRSNRADERTPKYDAMSKNGVVGRIGKATPTNPIPINIKHKIPYAIFI